MGARKIHFANKEYYHVFNRGVDKRDIFCSKEQQNFFFYRLHLLNTTDVRKYIANQRSRFKDKVIYPGGDKLVSIVAYSLLPNHFHLLLRQEVENGVSKFMQRLCTSYTKYFNQANERSGALFQGRFKATHLKGDLALPVLSAYVNLNHKHHKIDPARHLVKSSLPEYFNVEQGFLLCNPEYVLNIVNEVGGLKAYMEFSKHCSMSFALNKNNELTEKDFEF